MPLELDGAEVLRRVLASPEVFPLSRQEVNRMAQQVVVKQLRHRETSVEALRRIVDTLGGEAFRLVIDAMREPEVRSVTLRLDPLNTAARGADPAWLRGHLLQLAEGDAEPLEKAEAGAQAEREPPVKRTLSSRAMAAIARPRDDSPAKPKGKAKDKDKDKGTDKGKDKGKGKKKKKK